VGLVSPGDRGSRRPLSSRGDPEDERMCGGRRLSRPWSGKPLAPSGPLASILL